MAEFLDTTGISYHLEQIIKKANKQLIIISPFLKINNRIKQLLEDKNILKIDIRVIYGKNELQPQENNWLKSMTSIRTSYCENLHAKCYMNESEALITSMNLYEFSQSNNNEMGIYIKREDDPGLFNDVDEEASRLIRISDEIQVSVQQVPKEDRKLDVDKGKEIVKKSNSGFCIRCSDDIKLNINAPLCKSCFKSWDKFGDVDYQESYCLICGKDHNGSFAKPVCYTCYKKNKAIVLEQELPR
ncbi:phospholipase D family protein [Crocinitomix catalasitica]|uniref:phospholipase D family protein n=1 Tax=Crocinitomix catalasitica TaxID=184607 RepID=UPI000481783F|nr:phospholipase D family protein [Crocinitomix catalasitica]